jgi:surfactin synthase thioesterase subunit
VVAPNAPGHGALRAQPAVTDKDALVGRFLDRLGGELEGCGAPFAFFGHSMGTLVAYELTRRLVAGGCTAPVRLGLPACGGPRPQVAGAGSGVPARGLRRRPAAQARPAGRH